MQEPTPPIPDETETAARLQLVKSWAREMVTGCQTSPPSTGARRIADAGAAAEEELAVFHQLVQEREQGEADRPECERRILDKASLLLADTA